MSLRLFTKGDIIEVEANRYLVLEHRQGGFSDVYLTVELGHMGFNCLALKTLKPTEEWRGKQRAIMHREAASWVSLATHPNIVRCFYAADVGDIPFLVLEWVSDEKSNTKSLRDFMRRGPVPSPAALKVAVDICAALLHCREKLSGFAHGDIKPENVLIGEQWSFKLTDFGLAQTAFSLRSGIDTTEGQVWGTPHYMAPELWSGHPRNERSDIYAFGCLLYEMLEGEPPFPGPAITSVRRSHLEGEPSPPSLMTVRVWEVVRRCLSKDAAGRPEGYQELADMLYAEMSQGGVPAPPSPRSAHSEPTATDYGNHAITLMNTGHYEEALEVLRRRWP